MMDPPPRTAAGLAKYSPREMCNDCIIGEIDLLNEYVCHIDVVFMEPPCRASNMAPPARTGTIYRAT